jgi:hypothetical protein
MVNTSPDVIVRDLNNLRNVEGDGSSTGVINRVSINSTGSHKLVNEHIPYTYLNNNNNYYLKHQTCTNVLRVFHQNIRGLKYYKIDELLNALSPDFPHVLCLTEHHMNSSKRNTITIDHYNLGAVYCRKYLSKGGVCIFLHNSVNYFNTNLDKLCIDQTIEICAVKLFTAGHNICIIAVYRAPSGNFSQFLNSLDTYLLTYLCTELRPS